MNYGTAPGQCSVHDELRRGSAIMLLRTTHLVLRWPPNPSGAVLTPQAPHPPHKGVERCTDGFSLEKLTEV